MFNKFRKAILVVSLMCITALTGVAAACGAPADKTPAEINYSGTALPAANVGTEYTASVATATGVENISYSLKTGEELPEGLTLSQSGAISGTPEETGLAEFVVVASAGEASAEAEFSITVNAAGVNSYIFEAEYVDVTGLKGSGFSGAAEGLDLVVPSQNASNGYYIGFTHRAGFSITFNLTAEGADSEAEFSFSLASESGSMELTPDIFIIEVNGVKLEYDSFIVRSAVQGLEFATYTLSCPVSVADGQNTVTVTIGANEYMNGATGGPMIDNLQVSTSSKLSWEPILSNVE